MGVDVSFLVSSPRPRTFTGWRRLASPAARSVSGVTSSPAPKRASRSATLTGWVWVRNCSKGIDILRRGPRSLRVRMWIGFCPPSYPAFRLLPERAPAPLWPRPAVLPRPGSGAAADALARTAGARLRAQRNAARSPVGRGGASGSPFLSDLHHVAHDPEHASQLGAVGPPGLAADPAEPERAKRAPLPGAGSIDGASLLDDELSHPNHHRRNARLRAPAPLSAGD